MKKIQLFIISLLVCGYLMAQQRKVDEIAVITFCAEAEKLTNQQLQTLRGTAKSPVLNTSWDSKTTEHYKIDSFFLEMHAEQLTVANYSLEKTLEDIQHLNKMTGSGWIVSEVMKINNYSVFIAQMKSGDWGIYSFFTFNVKKNEVINGMLHYDKANVKNSDKALQILNGILNDMKFK